MPEGESMKVKKRYKKICRECGMKFMTDNNHIKECCEECKIKRRQRYSLEYRMATRPRNKPMMKNCEICGKVFETTRSAKLVCSEECRKEKMKRTQPKRNIERKQKKEQMKINGIKVSPLAWDNEQARKQGISYGQFKGKEYSQTIFTRRRI